MIDSHQLLCIFFIDRFDILFVVDLFSFFDIIHRLINRKLNLKKEVKLRYNRESGT